MASGVFETETTRWISKLMLMHDGLDPNARSEDPATRFERQILGGVYTTGHALIDMSKIATMAGGN